MSIEGYRKLIAIVGSIAGFVLCTYFGVPREQVDGLVQLLSEIAVPIAAIIGLCVSIYTYIKNQSAIDKAKIDKK